MQEGWRRGNHCISTSMLPTSTLRRSTSRSERSGAVPPKGCPSLARLASVSAMLMKYLSEYQPCRMRSTSSLNTEEGRRRPSNTLIRRDCSARLRGPGFRALLVRTRAMAGETPGDRNLYRRGQFLTALNRWLLLGLGVLALSYLRGAAGVQAGRALAIGAAYAAFAAAAQLWQARRPGRHRGLKVTHDVIDALAIGAGAACTGGMRSPVWLFLYPHIVAASARGGLGYALAMGMLDAVIVLGLGQLDPGSRSGSLSGLHAVALLWCGFIGGTVSSYLHEVQARLAEANASLQQQNERLGATLLAAEESRARQEQALQHVRESEERYRHLLERIQDGVVILSEGRIVYVNNVFARMAGDTAAGLVGADLQELLAPEDRQEILERYRRWQASLAETGELETRLRTRQGTLLTVALRAGAVVWEGHRSMITTVRDITRERRM